MGLGGSRAGTAPAPAPASGPHCPSTAHSPSKVEWSTQLVNSPLSLLVMVTRRTHTFAAELRWMAL